jgi:hypothetical protein
VKMVYEEKENNKFVEEEEKGLSQRIRRLFK